MLIIFLTGMLKLSHPPGKTVNELHANYPQESGGPADKSDHYHADIISDHLQQSLCSICTATEPRGQHFNPFQPKDHISAEELQVCAPNFSMLQAHHRIQRAANDDVFMIQC